MTICIYKITNLINDKIYVGQTIDFVNRMYEHFNKSNCTGRKFKNAISRYGKDSFKCEILEYLDDIDLLNEREQYYLDLLQPFDDNGYNLQRHSEKTNIGAKWSDEVKKKISDSLKKYYETHDVHNKGVPLSEERRKQFDRTGILHTEEWKQNASKIHKELGSGKRLQEWIELNGDPKLKPIAQLDKIVGNVIQEFESVKQASKQTTIGRTNITNCLTGYSKSAGGYKWVYLKDFPK